MQFDKDKEVEMARMFKALSHPARIWIVRQLAKSDHCVREFVDAIGVEFATVSRHLAKLKQAGLISSHKRGRKIWYTLNRSAVKLLLSTIR